MYSKIQNQVTYLKFHSKGAMKCHKTSYFVYNSKCMCNTWGKKTLFPQRGFLLVTDFYHHSISLDRWYRIIHLESIHVICTSKGDIILPGFFEVRANFFRLTSELRSEDFPTLDRPTRANSGIPSEGGQSSVLTLLFTNSACTT